MKKKNSKNKGTEFRQAEIIRAALGCFTEMGIGETSIAEICRRSKASVGSIYHHFKGKEQLAAAVYLEGIRDYQKGFVNVLLQHDRARDGIFAVVRYHLKWVENSTEWARFLFQNRHAEFMAGMDNAFKDLNEKFITSASAWFRQHMVEGTIRKLPPDIFMSVLLGPCQEMCRHMLAGSCCIDVENAAHELGMAAWRSLGME
jgi:AcrR family transcriptional regulator